MYGEIFLKFPHSTNTTQCYILNFKVIGLLVLENKIFFRFLPSMDMAAMLIM